MLASEMPILIPGIVLYLAYSALVQREVLVTLNRCCSRAFGAWPLDAAASIEDIPSFSVDSGMS